MDNTEKRALVISFCKEFIKVNGYVRVGYAVEKTIPRDVPVYFDHAFYQSVAYEMKESGEYLSELINHQGKDFNISINPDYKKPTLKDTHPFIYEMRSAIITAIIAGIVSWIVTVYTSKYQDRNQSLKDTQQDSALKELGESLQKIQKRK